MSLLRKVSWLFVLAIAFSTIAVPVVRAQTTSITNLQSPSHALLGADIRVTFTASFSIGYSGYYVGFFIYDNDAKAYATGTAYSSPDTCVQNTGQYTNSAACAFTTQSASGSDSVAFDLKFYTPRTYSLSAGAALGTSSSNVIPESFSFQSFSITVSDRLQLTVNTDPSVVVTVDGVPQTSGSVFLSPYPGSHTISVPSVVQVDDSTRLRFDRWEDGSTSTTRTLNLQDDTTLTANYITQYRLNLVGSQANATGSGWYDSGAVASFSVPSRSSLIWVFQGWYEGTSLVTSSNSGSIAMNAPHTLVARWGADYILVGGIIGVIVGIVVGLAYFGGKLPFLTKPSRKRARRKQAKRTQAVSEPAIEQATISKTTAQATAKPKADEKTPMFCTQCGAKITRESKFCKECGAKIS